MENYPNQSPVDKEISVNPSTPLVYKVNAEGFVEYVNHTFTELSGYEEHEIIGESMDILRHPDMPNVIFDVFKERLERKEPIKFFNKVLAKDGRFFWLLTDFETKVNMEGEVIAHYSRNTAAPTFAVHKISSLYKILSKIESKSGNAEVSKRYLIGFLEERNINYNQFIEELSTNHMEHEIASSPPPQQQDLTQRIMMEDDNRNLRQDNADYNLNFEIPNTHQNEIPRRVIKKKPKKKKSLLMKVFGK